MQSNKSSKKTRKDVSEPVAANSTEVSGMAEKTAKPRSSQSKSETMDTASAKKHRKAATVNVPEAVVQEPVSAPRAMAAAAGSNATASVVVHAAPVAKTTAEVSQERVQELAYDFWVADGKPHGNHVEHWLRAERELGIRK